MRLFLPIDEAECADLYDIALVELARLDVVIVHPHAVERVGVADDVAAVLLLDGGVHARDGHVVQESHCGLRPTLIGALPSL